MPAARFRGICVLLLLWVPSVQASSERSIEVAVNAEGEIRIDEVVNRLARMSGIKSKIATAPLALSTKGLARGLTSTFLKTALGPEVSISFAADRVKISIADSLLEPDQRDDWRKRLSDLGARTLEASERKRDYGMHALASYRPNDRNRPTICLVHGLNSSSGGFIYMVPWLEQAGYGIVVFDYAFNRKLEESSAAFARDWAAFRRNAGERQPWVIVAHSMGCLLARALVERDATWNRDVTSLALIAPVNQGSQLAKVQTIQQLLAGVQKVNGKNPAQAMLHLSDGLGQAAQDMLPRSEFLTRLNRLPRRQEVAYHILAGDRGVLSAYARSQVEGRLATVTKSAGILGALTKAATADLPEILDELTDDTGDGCVAVERTRLPGVTDWSVMHANHAELIRAPLLFSDPGPVACMPTLLRWLEQDRERAAK